MPLDLLDSRHLALHHPHALANRPAVELLVALSEGPDVHAVERHLHVVDGVPEQQRLLERVHAADPGAVGHADRSVAAARALDVGDRPRDPAVGWPQHAAVGTVARLQAFHGERAEDVRETAAPVLLLPVHGRDLEPGRHHDRAHPGRVDHRLLSEVEGARSGRPSRTCRRRRSARGPGPPCGGSRSHGGRRPRGARRGRSRTRAARRSGTRARTRRSRGTCPRPRSAACAAPRPGSRRRPSRHASPPTRSGAGCAGGAPLPPCAACRCSSSSRGSGTPC